VFHHLISHLLHPFFILPQLVEYFQVLCTQWSGNAVDEAEHLVPLLFSQVHRGETVHRSISHLFLLTEMNKPAHLIVGCIGLESYPLTDPFGTFPCNGLLRQFISQSHLELCTIEAPLPIQLRDVELPFLLGRFLLQKGW